MKRKKIVTIGGGTGSFTLLSGLKKYSVDISAIVSMADDGGSTGVLRDELGVLPPGDIRQCLVALCESSNELRALMNYRFDQGGLKGHAFGNLFLSALEKINKSFTKGVEQAIKILDVKGDVIPVSEKSMRLKIRLKNGKVLTGQSQLDHNNEIRKIGLSSVFLKKNVPVSKKALHAIQQADAIVIGPGDLFGSIIPALLVDDMSQAIAKSKAKVVYNCNLTNKKGQTDNYSAHDYVQAIEKYIGKGRINFVTFNSTNIPASLRKKYETREGKGSTLVSATASVNASYRLIEDDLLGIEKIKSQKSDPMDSTRSFLRHDGEKLAKILIKLLKTSK